MDLRTKKCTKCGWVYPYALPRAKCLFCKEPFTVGLCIKCGADTDNLKQGLCPVCYGERCKAAAQRHYAKNASAIQKDFDDWMNLVKQVPAEYPTLTNEQWLEACAYFDGCALCKSEHINTRGFFIPFRIGGRYSKWNVIPLCEDCAKKHVRVDNPFRVMHKNIGTKSHKGTEFNKEHYRNSEKRLQKIVEYLRPRLEEAANDR